MSATPSSDKKRFNLQQARQFLNPAWLAGAISIGFHSVLFAAGPSFPSLGFEQLTEAEEDVERRNVPLVELSAAEQERLPDFSGSFYNFETFGDLEALEPLFGDNNAPGSSNGPINSKPLLSPGSSSRSASGSRLPFGITSLEPGSRSPFPLTSLPGPPPSLNPGNTDSSTRPADESDSSESPGADAQASTDGDASDLEQTIAANSNPTDTLPLAERLQAYTFDSANTEAAEIDSRFDEWLASGQSLANELGVAEEAAIAAAFEQAAETGMTPAEESTDEAAETPDTGVVRPPIELPVDYRAGICLSEEPQRGLIGAWVGSEGTLLGEPQVIRSTGYPGINQQAIGYIETLDFSSAAESFTGYQFEVVVNYDPEGCVSVGQTTPEAPTEDSSPTEAPPEPASKAPAKAPASPEPTGQDTEAAPSSETSAPIEAESSATDADAGPENGAPSEDESEAGEP